MHELRLLRDVLGVALERMRAEGAGRITALTVEVRGVTHLTEAAARQHFSALAAGTPADGADLRIAWRPAHYRCLACRHRFRSAEPDGAAACPRCGSAEPLPEVPGGTLSLRSIRVET